MGDMLGEARYLFLALAVLGVIAILVIRGMRKRALTDEEKERWAKSRPAPVPAAELDRLLRWQRNMRLVAISTLFYLGAMVGFASALPPEAMLLRWVAFLILPALVIGGVVLQFSVRCPRCSMHLGLQTSLGLPETCERCGAALRK